ncbi:MAG TPA: hypothetical protein VFW02_07720 [Candidatus Limnocylindrales bacterium]|nr:hypothetical protein [Candidatus Limnocylindrales bacterium]
MQHDPATLGSAVILFGIAVMVFGGATGSTGAAGVLGIVGLIIAFVGLLRALTRPGS